MHSLAYVLIPQQGDVLSHVGDVLKEHEHQWDWFVVGGRWDGELTGAPHAGDCYRDRVEGNVTDARQLLDDPQLPTKLPAVIATRDVWLDVDHVGTPWIDEVRTILQMNPRDRVVAVDTHN